MCVRCCALAVLTFSYTHPLLYLQSDHVSQLVMIPGIITAASKPRHAPVDLTVMCRDCRLETKLSSLPGVGGFSLPRTCSLSAGANGGATKCSLDPWIIMPSKSAFTDTQTLKLQVCCHHAHSSCFQDPFPQNQSMEQFIYNYFVRGISMNPFSVHTVDAQVMNRDPSMLHHPST